MTQTSVRNILLTGATGFIGRNLLTRLLDAGHAPVLPARAEDDGHARERVQEALSLVRPGDGDALDRCRVLAADLRRPRLGLEEADYRSLVDETGTVISVAACTTFEARPDGEPRATNVEGLRRLAGLALDAGAAVHHFSTAFVCGDRPGCWPEAPARPGRHHNAYEASKWEGEALLREAAGRGLAELTVYRPSITVTGRERQPLPAEHGISLLANSLRTAARLITRRKGHGPGRPADLGRLRVDADPGNPVHLVPVDWVADVFMHIFERQELHGRTYHLALDEPPTVDRLRRALEGHLNIRLGPYTDEDLWSGHGAADSLEARFYRMAHSLRHYFRQPMTFGTAQLAAALGDGPLAGARFRESWWPTLLDSIDGRQAKRAAPGRAGGNGDGRHCRDYFERWLPDRAPRSALSKITSLTVDVGFWVRGAGEWTLAFRGGTLERVLPSAEAGAVRTGYRTDLETFNAVVGGRLDPQQAFLTDRAEIVGDVEAGLKFAMILQQFVNEFPWSPGADAAAGPREAAR